MRLLWIFWLPNARSRLIDSIGAAQEKSLKPLLPQQLDSCQIGFAPGVAFIDHAEIGDAHRRDATKAEYALERLRAMGLVKQAVREARHAHGLNQTHRLPAQQSALHWAA